jgi:hypothetical protein
MQYKVLYNEELDVLIRVVNENIQAGWTPLGGLATSPWGSYYQAMIRSIRETQNVKDTIQ